MVSRKQSWLSLGGKFRNSCWERETVCGVSVATGTSLERREVGAKEDAKQQQKMCKVTGFKLDHADKTTSAESSAMTLSERLTVHCDCVLYVSF